MPMLKGTKPFIKNWAEINPLNLPTVMHRYCKQFKTAVRTTVSNNYTQYLDTNTGDLVARVYRHKRSSQVLLKALFIGLIPKEENIIVTVKTKS